MYGSPAFSGFGPEIVRSIGQLVEAIKRRQLLKPKGQFKMTLGLADFKVAVLPNGYIEFDGEVQSTSIEREMDESIRAIGAKLDDLVE